MADVASWGPPRRWWLLVLILALVLMSACDSARDMPPPSRSIGPSDGADLQLRPVIEIVPRASADWDAAVLTCIPRDATFEDCVASTVDATRVVFVGSGAAPDKYVLGPAIVDGTDVERATSQPEAQTPARWSVVAHLTDEGTAAFAAATRTSVGSPIAIVIDGIVVSSPTVAAPITSGNVVLASGLTERGATALASQLDPG